MQKAARKAESCSAAPPADEICPVNIEILDKILDMRRYLSLMESNFPAELGNAYRAMENQGNPWGMNASQRNAWIEEVDFEVRVFGMHGEEQIPDDVEYLFAPNAGEPAAPIAKIASGGELSRVSLALEEALSDASESRTLVFDEIDAGLGGRAGVTLGKSLKRIATQHQVLCVTHLPQVAAQADVHLQVRKREEGGRTITEVRRLTGDERMRELASMLAGDAAGSGAEAAARELLAKAGQSGS